MILIKNFYKPSGLWGCGDCSTQSNCVSVEPLFTDMVQKEKLIIYL